jgi:Uri superfamily endonuclease
MTSEPGTYVLLLRAETERAVEVGALGEQTIRAGLYVYVGSAFGPGGLRARVRRHAQAEGALHWHVDYLRAATTLEAVWYTHDDERRECTWATVLRTRADAHVPIPRFGASDCDCPAHLVAFDDPPSLPAVRDDLQRQCSAHAPVAELDSRDGIE